MAEFKVQLCKLCLNAITDKNFTVIDNFESIIDLLLLKLDPEYETDVTCQICSLKLIEAYEFKLSCLNNNKTITSYTNGEGNLPLDIRDIYMKEVDDKKLLDIHNLKVCRLCMQLTGDDFIPIEKGESAVLKSYIPEIDIDLTADPLLCKTCFECLHSNASYLEECQNINGEITNDDTQKDDLESIMNQFETDRKIYPTEDTKEGLKLEEVLIKSEYDIDEPQKTDQISGKAPRMYKCDKCQYQTKHRSNLATHRNVHINKSELPVHKCKFCDFKTIHKRSMFRHQSQHKDKVTIQTYRCDKCDFQTKRQLCLTQHLQKHEAAGSKVYKCDQCDLQTIYKRSLVRHQTMHKKASESKIYTCSICGLQTVYKKSLIRHRLTHQEEFRKYKCDLCDFETKHQGVLVRHGLKHSDVVPVPLYECKECGYLSKNKYHLASHELTHRNASEVTMYKCDRCPYESKFKGHLASHVLSHKDLSEVAMYKCDECDFQSKRKAGLIRHRVRHVDPAELILYKCERCGFQTKFKESLARHRMKYCVE